MKITGKYLLTLLLSLILFAGIAHAQKKNKKEKSENPEKQKPAADKACLLLEEGIEAYKADNYDKALSLWEKGYATGKGDCYGKCLFNMAFVYRNMEDYDNMRKAFQRVLDSDLNDRDPGPDIMEPYANYHHNAAMKWALIERDLGNYDETFRLLRLAETEYDVDIFSATTYEKRLVSIATIRSNTYYMMEKPKEAVMAILEKLLDTDWGYKGDFSSFSNVDFYSGIIEMVDSLAEAEFGKEKLRDALIAAEQDIKATPATWKWSGEPYLAGELTLLGYTLHFGTATEDADLESLREDVRHSPLWRYLGCPVDEEGVDEEKEDD